MGLKQPDGVRIWTSLAGRVRPMLVRVSKSETVALGWSPASTCVSGQSTIEEAVVVERDEGIAGPGRLRESSVKRALPTFETLAKEERKKSTEVRKVPSVVTPAP